MAFTGIKIITLSKSKVSSLHIALKGTMNAMLLKDLADKTRRSLRGRREKTHKVYQLIYMVTLLEF